MNTNTNTHMQRPVCVFPAVVAVFFSWLQALHYLRAPHEDNHETPFVPHGSLSIRSVPICDSHQMIKFIAEASGFTNDDWLPTM
jgi:hypothetical protein